MNNFKVGDKVLINGRDGIRTVVSVSNLLDGIAVTDSDGERSLSSGHKVRWADVDTFDECKLELAEGSNEVPNFEKGDLICNGDEECTFIVDLGNGHSIVTDPNVLMGDDSINKVTDYGDVNIVENSLITPRSPKDDVKELSMEEIAKLAGIPVEKLRIKD